MYKFVSNVIYICLISDVEWWRIDMSKTRADSIQNVKFLLPDLTLIPTDVKIAEDYYLNLNEIYFPVPLWINKWTAKSYQEESIANSRKYKS
jgi:hypothetical protein